MDDQKPEQPRRSGSSVGAGLAIGAGLGTALFAATDGPVWIGVFAAIGAALGATIESGRRP